MTLPEGPPDPHDAATRSGPALLPDRTLAAIALMLFFCVVAPLIDVFSKLAGTQVSTGLVTLGRFAVQGVVMAPVLPILGLTFALAPAMLRLTFLRAALAVVSTYCFVAALRFMPIADALAIVFVEPFIILLIGRFAMREQVGPRRLAACAIGFLGSLLVIQPSLAVFGLVALFPLGTALTFALYMILTRRMARDMHPVAMQFHTAWAAAALCLPLLAGGAALGEPSLSLDLPQGVFWLWVILTGVAATVSHMAMTYALSFAPSSTLAPLHYLEMVSAAAFGYFVFGDFPDALTWTGIAIIVASGLYIIHRERVVARGLSPPAAPP
jgi:drug/metabolite transporter (DMT)-like permease